MNQTAILQEAPDFSLVLGGPLFQLFRRAHLSGGVLELLQRRIMVITMIAWLPLLILSSLGGKNQYGQCDQDVGVTLRRAFEGTAALNRKVHRFLPSFQVSIASSLHVRSPFN